jgi:transcriptional regulator with XRE-family HTH domain
MNHIKLWGEKVGKSYIRQLREGRGMTQQQLADAIGVCESSISAWETKHRNIAGESLLAVIAYFELGAEDIPRLSPNFVQSEKQG